MLFRFGAFQAVRSEVVRRGGFGRGFRGEGQSNRASGGDWWPYCSESGVLLIVIVERAAPTLRSPYRSLVVALIDPFTGTLFYLLGPCSISLGLSTFEWTAGPGRLSFGAGAPAGGAEKPRGRGSPEKGRRRRGAWGKDGGGLGFRVLGLGFRVRGYRRLRV